MKLKMITFTVAMMAAALWHLDAQNISFSTPCINGLQVDINGGVYNSPTNLVWNWGDGQRAPGWFPQSHIYASAGQYTIQATAYYNDGTTASNSKTVNVAQGVLSGCYSWTITAGQGGSISYQGSVASGIVPSGQSVTLEQAYAVGGPLTANPSSGHSFVDWSASPEIWFNYGSSNTPSVGAVVDGNSTITANFSQTSPPQVTTQPQGQSLAVGGSGTFTVIATGTGLLSYQWQRNGTAIATGGDFSGVNTATLTLNNAQVGDSGNITVAVSDPYGNTTISSAARLSILPLSPIYVTSGDSVLLYGPNGQGSFQLNNTIAGNNTELYSPSGLVVDSQNNLYVSSYYDNAVNVYPAGSSGNASPTAVLTGSSTQLSSPIGLALDGNGILYVANNNLGSITEYQTSQLLSLGPGTVNLAPSKVITSSHVSADPKDFDVPRGIAVDTSSKVYVSSYIENWVNVYNAGASGKPAPFSTLPSWFSDIVVINLNPEDLPEDSEGYGGAIAGIVDIAVTAVGGTIDLEGQPTGIAVGANGFVYVANQLQNSVSVFTISSGGSSNLVAVIAGSQTGLNEPATLAVDGSGCLYVANSGSGTVTVFDTTVLNDANLIANGNSIVFNLNPIATISGLGGSVPSEAIIALTLASPPTTFSGAPPFINVSPQSQSVAAGSNATFNVTATGYTPLTIQWFKGASQVLNGGRFQIVNGADVGGVDTSTLTISNVITSDGGNYYVVVTNVVSSITSSNANLTVTTPAITTNTLTVASSNPGSGVSITVSPNDTGGNGNGSTPFARNYTNNTQVTLTAPSTAGGNNFQNWQQNGADYSTSLSATITMNASYTMTAIYASPPSSTYTLTVASSNPNSGVSISASPNDNNGSGGGSTTFTLTYNSNKLVYLTAPSSAGGNNFLTWQLDGVTYNNALDSGLTMNGNHTMTAVFGGIGIIGLSGNLAFGNVQTNAQAVRQFTIQSQGGYQPLHVSSISYTSPGFSGSWSGTIPIGGSTNVSVTFSPTTNGNYNGWVIVNSDATVGSNSNAISGTGVVAPPPPPVTPFPVAAFSVIYSFPYQSALSGPFAYGANPGAGLVQGTDGDFYGTTVYGGGYGEGVIFRMNAAGSNQLLYSFPAKTSQPGAQLTFGNDGNLYGTMRFGGVNGLGSVFNGVFSTIYSFAESSSDQSGEPISPLIQGTDGYFYGTTRWGWNGGGSVFRVTTTGAFKLINSLDDSLPGVGWELIAPLVQGMDGNLYGTTFAGGTNGPGTVFKLTLSGALTPLYSFTGGLDGGHPQAGLVQDKSGYLYGTTSEGGTFYDGTVFKMATNGNLIWAVSLNGTNGSNAGYGIPAFLEAPLIQASDGNLYGVTPSGGTFGAGTVFQISTNGLLIVLHSFQGSDGANPFGLMQGRDGNLYGTTWEGGTDGGGTVFRLVIPPGTPSVNTIGGVFNIKWNAVPGQTYQVQYSTDLSKTNWMSLISAITPTNSTAAAIDSVGPDSQRFYRIVEYPEAW